MLAVHSANGEACLASIGIFDSGVGGLTVLKALRQALPSESFVYLGDTARLPYGSKSAETIRRYLAQNMRFLQNLGVKAVVVACNSASTVLAGDVWDALPVYGVIRPGARQACSVTRNRRIGVLGTAATIQSGAYPEALREFDTAVFAVQQPCPLLVPLVEEGWEGDSVTREVLKRYLHNPLSQNVDTLILGCTHYPVLKTLIAEIAGPDVCLVDSAEAVARQLGDDLNTGKVAASDGTGSTQIWTTDTGPSFQAVGRRILEPFRVGEWHSADIS